MTREELTPNPLYDSPCNPLLVTQYRTVDVLSPDSFEPRLDEIVHALPNINRYNGHTIRPYSVAEHSINCMAMAGVIYGLTQPHHQLYFLLHDGAEAYLQDIVRPIKRYAPDSLLVAEKIITRNIMKIMPFSDKQMHEITLPGFQACAEEIDTRMAVTELRKLFPSNDATIDGFEHFSNLEIVPWEPPHIRTRYMEALELAIKKTSGEYQHDREIRRSDYRR